MRIGVGGGRYSLAALLHHQAGDSEVDPPRQMRITIESYLICVCETSSQHAGPR